MDIRWKDGNGNILNANNERIIYYEAETDNKIKITKEETKKITIEDGLMNIFRDFESDLVITIIIPKKSKKDAVKIFNDYDKTGKMFKGNTNNFLLDLILESSVIIGNPFAGVVAFGFIILISINLLLYFAKYMFGEVGIDIVRIMLFGYLIYSVISYVSLRIKRKHLKEDIKN
jgi:hypothetical protein